MDKSRETMTEGEFAKAVGVSRVTLWRLRAKGLVPHYKIGTRILYSKQHIEQFLKSHEQGAKQTK
jgi:excisionase family DNA binding protein